MPLQPPAVAASAKSSSSSHALFPAGQLTPFILVTFLFFLWGIPNNLNDVLIRQFMKSFEISRFQAGLVQSAFYMGYFVLAIPAALLMKRAGYKAGLVTGLLLLTILISNTDRAMSREQLTSMLWRDPPSSNVVEVYVGYLRRKLGADRIRTVRGKGYVLEE